jgi:hypothetical protein
MTSTTSRMSIPTRTSATKKWRGSHNKERANASADAGLLKSPRRAGTRRLAPSSRQRDVLALARRVPADVFASSRGEEFFTPSARRLRRTGLQTYAPGPGGFIPRQQSLRSSASRFVFWGLANHPSVNRDAPSVRAAAPGRIDFAARRATQGVARKKCWIDGGSIPAIQSAFGRLRSNAKTLRQRPRVRCALSVCRSRLGAPPPSPSLL